MAVLVQGVLPGAGALVDAAAGEAMVVLVVLAAVADLRVKT